MKINLTYKCRLCGVKYDYSITTQKPAGVLVSYACDPESEYLFRVHECSGKQIFGIADLCGVSA